MKKQLARATTVALIMGFAVAAQADPIYFDFTATVLSNGLSGTDAAVSGSPVSGGFNFDTDRLYHSPTPDNPAVFVDWQPTDLTEPLAFLSFGSREVTLPAYGGTRYSAIFFNDNCLVPADCTVNPDSFSLYAYSGEEPASGTPPDFTGSYRSVSLLLLPGVLAPNYSDFDAATVDPTAIVTLPADGILGIYSELLWDCVAGSCTNTEVRSLDFSVDSVTRGLGPRAVPEPATLGLSGAAGFGLLLFGRRRPVAPSPREQQA